MSESASETAKILIWDIETRSLVADYGSILCIGWKWYGEKKVNVLSIHDMPGKHVLDDKPLVKYFIEEVWNKADMAVGHYSSGHDEPFLRTRALIHKLTVPKDVTTIDSWGKMWKRFKFSKNSLLNVSNHLGLTPKYFTPTADFEKVLYGDKPAMKRIKKHCKMDVMAEEELYERIKPYIVAHPRVTHGKWECRRCGSNQLQKRGWRYSAQKGKQQLVKCKSCGGWDQKGVKEEPKK